MSSTSIRRRSFLSALAGAFVLLACAKTDVPTDPVWGKEPCSHCRMLVGDRRVAAQAVYDGERHFFDDPGCLVLWLDEKEKKDANVNANAIKVWVRDSESGARWIEARSATYVGGKSTPMDFGFEGRSSPLGIEGALDFAAMRTKVLAKSRGSANASGAQ